MNNQNNEIIERIKSLCDKNKISINKLLQDCKLNKSVIDNMKKGSIPSMDKIYKISDYFNVSTDYLLCKTDDPAPPNKEDKEEDHGLVIIQRLRKNLPPADNERMVNVIKAMFDESFPKDKNKEKDDNVQK